LSACIGRKRDAEALVPSAGLTGRQNRASHAKGFDFAAVTATRRYEMGSRQGLMEGLKIRAEVPLPVQWRLLRNGKVVSESTGRTLEASITEPGNYRTEAWLTIAGEKMIWILSNPLYIRPAAVP
jgi:hypothetical protein